MMMVVMSGMAAALHLQSTVKANPAFCQMSRFYKCAPWKENGAVRGFSVITAIVIALTLPTMGQNAGLEGRAVRSVPAPEDRIDINHATLQQLLKAPGMSASWAGRIVRFRPYRTKQDLLDRGVVPGDVYQRIKDSLIAHREAH